VGRLAQIGENAALVECLGNLGFGLLLGNERSVYPADDFDFLGRARDEHHPVGLDAFVLASRELAL
jgi:hypothetical protein